MNLSFVKFKKNISVFPAKALTLGLQEKQLRVQLKKERKKKTIGKGGGQLKFVSFLAVLTRLNKIYALR